MTLFEALKILPEISSSPVALFCYVVTIAAWAYFGVSVRRHKNLLNNLEKLRPEDRLKALESQLGEGKLRRGLDPEQWLRSRIHKYFFLAFLAGCTTLLVIVALVINHPKGDVEIDVTPYRSQQLMDRLQIALVAMVGMGQANAADLEFSKPESKGRVSPNQIQYDYEKKDGKIYIQASSLYLRDVREGKEVSGFAFEPGVFIWDYPALSVKVVNNTDKTLLLSEAVLQIEKSTVDTRPILAVYSPGSMGRFWFANEGWGRVRDPHLALSFYGPTCSSDVSVPTQDVPLTTFLDGPSVDISKLIDPTLRSASLECPSEAEKSKLPPYMRANPFYGCKQTEICVRGTLSYLQEDNSPFQFRFKTKVYLGPIPAPPVMPSYTYDVRLEAGKAGYSIRVPISQEIQPGKTDHFLLQVASDKTSTYDLNLKIYDAQGKAEWSGDIDLEVFVPRSNAGLGKPRKR